MADAASQNVAGVPRCSLTPEAVLDRLSSSYNPWSLDTSEFASELQFCTLALSIQSASRSYRSEFSPNYRVLFRQQNADYCAEVLEACLKQEEQVCVNGTWFQISALTAEKSLAMRQCLGQLSDMLNLWPVARLIPGGQVPDVKTALRRLDFAWAEFEKWYVHELMSIEAISRQPLERAVALERELQGLENQEVASTTPTKGKTSIYQGSKHLSLPLERRHAQENRSLDDDSCASLGDSACCTPSSLQSPSMKGRSFSGAASPCARHRQVSGELARVRVPSERADTLGTQSKESRSKDLHRLARAASSTCASNKCRKVLQNLVMQVAGLNALANVEGRGREDLTSDVLEAAADMFLNSEQPPAAACSTTTAAVAVRQFLARRVLEGFLDLRRYLVAVADRMLYVDPQLSNNNALAESLLVWEEAWELGSQFVLQPSMLEALCSTAVQMSETQRFAPELAKHVDDQGAELFLILPRLVLLGSLAEPTQSALPAHFIPHHFLKRAQGNDGPSDVPTVSYSAEMTDLSNDFVVAVHAITTSRSCQASSQSAWEVLVRRAIAGPGAETDGDAGVDCFLRRLEGVSLELQRTNPEAWNGCCAVLLQCISAAMDASRA